MSIYREIEVTAWDNPLEMLPGDIRAALSPEETHVYKGAPTYFARKAKECEYVPLRHLFREIGKLESYRLHLFGKEEPLYRVYFGFFFAILGQYVRIRLPSGRTLPGEPPDFLVSIYRHTAGIFDRSECQVGWVAPEDIQSAAAAGFWTSEENPYDLDRCFPVFHYGSGDYAGYRDGGVGFHYNHEEGMLEDLDLESFACDCFSDYLKPSSQP
jgi:hypothetical protein